METKLTDTDVKTLIKNLHPLETRLLLKYGPGDELTGARLQQELAYKEGHCNQAFSWLSGKGLLREVGREAHTYYALTDYGRAIAKDGSAEERIISCLKDGGPKALPELAAALSLESKDVGSAFGALSKEGVLRMNGEKKAEYTGAAVPERLARAKALIAKAQQSSAGGMEGALDAAALSKEELADIATMTKKRGVSDTAFKTVERET